MTDKEIKIGTTTPFSGSASCLPETAKFAGLRWDLIISAEMFERYKPAPATYPGAPKFLYLQPEEFMMFPLTTRI